MPPRISVNSLINEDALPDWLRNAAHSGALPPTAEPRGMTPGTGALGGRGWESPQQPVGNGPLPSPDARGSGPLTYHQPPSSYQGVPPSPVGSGSLGARHLFDESALPEWLKSGTAGQGPDLPTASLQGPYGQVGYGAAGAGAPVAPIPNSGNPAAPSAAAFPSIEHAGSFQAPLSPESGLSGTSLIDTNALPQWLSGIPGGPSQVNYGREQARGIPGSSLVDENALPQWLRNEQPATPNQAASSTWNGPQAGNQSMPSWLNQGYADDARTPHMESSYTQSSAWTGYPTPMTAGQPANPAESYLPGALAAGEFVDEAALPEWLRSQSGIPGMAPPSGTLSAGQPKIGTHSSGHAAPNLQEASLLANGGAAGTFSASDLIDPSALPDWVRGSEAGPAASFSSTAGWTTNRQPVPPAPETPWSDQPTGAPAWSTAKRPTANSAFNSMNASSAGPSYAAAIPNNELPSWLANDPAGPAGPRNPKGPPARQQPGPSGWQDRAGGMDSASPRSMGGRADAYGSRGAYDTPPDDVSFDDFEDYSEFDDYSGYDEGYRADPRREQPERRGWRRFFGRK
jgi:hypothetical protein